MPTYEISPAQLAAFHKDGYLMVPGLFSADEAALLKQVATADRKVASAGSMADGDGGASKIWLTTQLKDDIYSAFSHSLRVIQPLRQILDDDVLFYHHKMMLKEPRVGGAWEWHQDYGYWYNDGFLFPNMLSCMIAVDRANKANGCLQVLKGSHAMGRIEHGKVGAQTGADVARVEAARQRLELIYCEMEPGTALFFHSNLLHRSDKNLSEFSRWCLISCYTAAANRSIQEVERPHTCCSAVEPWPDAKIMELGRQQLAAMTAG